MVLKLFSNLKRGITLIEIVVVAFIISLFSLILISDFPKIQRQFALSRVTYKLAQDLRKTQDLGLSGVQVLDVNKHPIAVQGYGIYINLAQSTTQYIIYADASANGSQTYDAPSDIPCEETDAPDEDCIIETIDLGKENTSLFIKDIINITGVFTSINFSPPDPIIYIDKRCQQFCEDGDHSRVGIVLGLDTDPSATRTIWVNTSGLINVQ